MAFPDQFPSIVPLDDGAPLTLHEVVRELPGRRLVCRGVWQGRAVYAKLFFGAKAGRDHDRDAAGVRALAVAGIPTPELLYDGFLAGDDIRALVFSAITEGGNAEEIWHRLPRDGVTRLALAQRLVMAVAMHHKAGLVQRDMYLKNFLVTESEVLTLDGDGIHSLRSPREAIGNLAVLLSKFPPSLDRHVSTLWRGYAQCLGYVEEVGPGLLMRVARERRRMISKYADEKVLRACTDVHVERHGGRILAVSRPWWQPQYRTLFEDPESFMQPGRCVFLKEGGSATVAMVDVGGDKLVVKRYNYRPSPRGWLRRLKMSRARASWCNAHRLGMYEIQTPRPVALIEERRAGVLQGAYFISEFLDAPDARVCMEDGFAGREGRPGMFAAIAGLMHDLFLARIAHGDLKGTNLKIDAGAVALIDLDAMHQHGDTAWFRRRHMRDLRRLFKNWPRGSMPHEGLKAACAAVYGDDWATLASGIEDWVND